MEHSQEERAKYSVCDELSHYWHKPGTEATGHHAYLWYAGSFDCKVFDALGMKTSWQVESQRELIFMHFSCCETSG